MNKIDCVCGIKQNSTRPAHQRSRANKTFHAVAPVRAIRILGNSTYLLLQHSSGSCKHNVSESF